jgi:hypothetical protein
MQRQTWQNFAKGWLTRVAILALLVFVLLVLKMLAGPPKAPVKPREPAIDRGQPVPMRPGPDPSLTNGSSMKRGSTGS